MEEKLTKLPTRFGQGYSRQTLISQLENDPELKIAIAQNPPKKSWLSKYRPALRTYLKELVPNPSDCMVSVVGYFSRSILDRMFTKIDVVGLDKIPDLGKNESLIYLPSHRSHLDSLLLFHLLNSSKQTLPHTLTGINMNIPVLGRVLKMLGAVFIRRVFKGQPFYSETVRRFLFHLLGQRLPLMFYIEGTRSRNGKSLPPKVGIFSMLMQYLQQNPTKDLKLVPITIVYEKLVEESSYIKELGGLPKRSESITGLIKSRHVLNVNYGASFVTFARPLSLRELMNSYLQREQIDTFPSNLQSSAYELGMEVIDQINMNTRTSAVPLVAMALLSETRQGFRKQELIDKGLFLLGLHEFIRGEHGASLVGISESLESIVDFMFEKGAVGRHPDAEGAVYFFKHQDKILLNIYKNILVHQFVVPSLVSTLLLRGPHTKQAVLANILFFDHLFRYEFVFPRRHEFDRDLDAFLQFAEDKNIITVQGDKLALKDEHNTDIVMLSRLLLPFREAFFAASRTLLGAALNFPIEMKDLVEKMRHSTTSLLLLGDIESPEANLTDTFQNIIRFYLEEGYLQAGSSSEQQNTKINPGPKLDELAEIVGWLLPKHDLKGLVGGKST